MRAPVQFVTYRLRAVVPVDKPEPLRDRPAPYVASRSATRDVFFVENGQHRPVSQYRWENLRPGASISHPAIIEGAATSIVVPPGWAVMLDTMRNVIFSPLAASAPDR